MRKVVISSGAPRPIGAYSQAVVAGGMLYTAGQIGIDPASGELVPGAGAQTRRAMENIRSILEEAGTGLDLAVKVSIYITDMSDFAVVNEVFSELMEEPWPARSVVEVSALPKGALVEIEAVAQIKEDHR
ncbi:MAG: hypothetical protein AVO35_00495 [Candidatus Aegiribacteria sp. MLS_C]|nr:MAG: hypothetical protein AVO35_00495 [Candidatus Aegiribacteria sp. MLS_C]